MIDQFDVEDTLTHRASVRSIITRLIKVKRFAVVNRVIFRVLKSKKRPREIPVNTKPVKGKDGVKQVDNLGVQYYSFY